MLYESIEYKGFSINVHYDSDAGNPHHEGDFLPPMLIRDSSGIRAEGGEDLRDLVRTTGADWLGRGHEIAQALGTTFPEFVAEAFEQWPDKTYSLNNILDALLDEYLSGRSESEEFEQTEELLRVLGFAVEARTYRGYVQSDWAEVLVCATPDYCERIGAIPSADSLNNSLQLYFDWMRGDCFGYVIDGIETDNSCWGFLGRDHEASGLLYDAKDAIDFELSKRKQARVQTLKRLIRAKAPLWVRPDLIGNI